MDGQRWVTQTAFVRKSHVIRIGPATEKACAHLPLRPYVDLHTCSPIARSVGIVSLLQNVVIGWRVTDAEKRVTCVVTQMIDWMETSLSKNQIKIKFVLAPRVTAGSEAEILVVGIIVLVVSSYVFTFNVSKPRSSSVWLWYHTVSFKREVKELHAEGGKWGEVAVYGNIQFQTEEKKRGCQRLFWDFHTYEVMSLTRFVDLLLNVLMLLKVTKKSLRVRHECEHIQCRCNLRVRGYDGYRYPQFLTRG